MKLFKRTIIGLAALSLLAVGMSLLPISINITHATNLDDAPKVYSGPYVAKVVSVYDGDTVNLEIYTAPNQVLHTGLRVEGVDTPELSRSGCKSDAMKSRERLLGAVAKRYVQARYPPGILVQVRDLQNDKYGGRHVGILERKLDDKWVRLDDELLADNLADPYGSRKERDPLKKLKSWCEGK